MSIKFPPVWTPFQPAELKPLTPEQREVILLNSMKLGRTREEAEEALASVEQDEIWLNSRYQVNIRRGGSEVHLSIKRIDKLPNIDWRDLQRIKNELVGEECEAVELYPAESRLVDTANQRHLWAISDPTFRFPIGFEQGRQISNIPSLPGSTHRQRRIRKP